MFTGIIQKTAEIKSVARNNSGLRVKIEKPAGWKIKPGESVSVDGVCSTVASIDKGCFEVEYMPETLKKTTTLLFKEKDVVNLELPLALGETVGGHFVQGHVDVAGEILGAKKIGNSVILEIGFPAKYGRLIAEKGSISVNGVSLTAVHAAQNRFSVSLVNYTLGRTNLRGLKKGDKVNLEFDMFARYLDALINKSFRK